MNRLDRVRRRHGRIFGVDVPDREWHTRTADRIDDAGTDYRLERERDGREPQVHGGDRVRSDDDARMAQLPEAEPARVDHVRGRRYAVDAVAAGGIGRGAEARTGHGDLDAGEWPIGAGIGDHAGNATGRALRVRTWRERDEQRRREAGISHSTRELHGLTPGYDGFCPRREAGSIDMIDSVLRGQLDTAVKLRRDTNQRQGYIRLYASSQ